MKKIFFLIIFIVLIFFYWYFKNNQLFKDKTAKDEKKSLIEKTVIPTRKIIITPTPTKKIIKITKLIFVPYWSDFEALDKSFDRYFYFGIAVDSYGINKNETGYLKIQELVNRESFQSENWWLTLRMIDDNLNEKILDNEKIQEKIIQETILISKEKGFKGIVLDLEISNIFNIDIKNKINDFVKKFYTASKENYKSFSLCLYGDLFYRKRPYDLEFLSKNSDEILIMAYDFSKTIGEPGPNFPFDLGHKYNYSFKLMIDDFLKYLLPEKITVVFGMYGYQWNVDEKKRPISQAKALTLNQIKEKFYKNNTENQGVFDCQLKNCLIKRDKISGEMEINYFFSSATPDSQGIYRLDYYVVWHEDERSVEIKTEYLKEKGIGSIGYWANSYF